jgi:hypothetical protein
VSAADAVLWDLNRLSLVIDRIHSSCQNEAKTNRASHSIPLRHDGWSVAREASAAPAASLYAGHVQQLGGANPLPNLMEVKG